jgi:hypothetical protein
VSPEVAEQLVFEVGYFTHRCHCFALVS